MVEWLLMMALSEAHPISGSPAVESRKAKPQASFVGYGDGKCAYMTGDVGLSEADYENILRRYYDHNRRMVIVYTANVPRECINKAWKIAAGAGLREVTARRWTLKLEKELSR